MNEVIVNCNVVKATKITPERVGDLNNTFISISYPLLMSFQSVVGKYGKF